ncbi:MAG TPA: hypothetical protein VKB42_16500 [Dongiaceae bacterium]|nr:hypothetical protein [Dongiaceae bacterium]
MGKGTAYRSFRRRVLLATAALFLLGILAALLLRNGRDLWTVVLWTAICSPLLIALAIAVMLPLRRMAARLGLADGSAELRPRPAAILWMMAAILLPWVAAWIAADRIGLWYMAGRSATDGGDAYLWAVRLLAGLVTYSLASAIGVLIAFLIDSRTGDQTS